MAAIRASEVPTCGTSEPATDPRASSRSSTSAVRIERRVRHTIATERRRVTRGGEGVAEDIARLRL